MTSESGDRVLRWVEEIVWKKEGCKTKDNLERYMNILGLINT